MSGPVRSGPVRSRSGPVRSGPVRSGPVRSGPVRSGPARSGPVRSGPVRSGPVRSGWVRLGPVRSGPVSWVMQGDGCQPLVKQIAGTGIGTFMHLPASPLFFWHRVGQVGRRGPWYAGQARVDRRQWRPVSGPRSGRWIPPLGDVPGTMGNTWWVGVDRGWVLLNVFYGGVRGSV
eukprot:gene16923-biopygen2283